MTERCNKPMPKARNGADRGPCSRANNHNGPHGNATCWQCSTELSIATSTPFMVLRGSGRCNGCVNLWLCGQRRVQGILPKNIQVPGQHHAFPCGCSGILPAERGQSNKAARWNVDKWECRVRGILRQSRSTKRLRRQGYVPIDPKTSHAVIRAMMEEPNCWRCIEPLNWDDLGLGKTPSLHHNNATGALYGFVHHACNMSAEEAAYDRLFDECMQLRIENQRLRRTRAA